MSEETINKIIHARWGIENEGFNELKNQWNMSHCYIANENAIDVIVKVNIKLTFTFLDNENHQLYWWF